MSRESLIGLGCIILGVFSLWWTIKTWIKNDYLTANIKGLIAGIGFIILGILLLIGYAKWQ